MRKKKPVDLILILMFTLFSASNGLAQNPNFYIYLCFGQSNMQGQGPIFTQDNNVNNRFKVFQAIKCSNLNREKATWYTAVPPTCQCYSLLSPADYFGTTMVANLPDSITVGIINVAVAGCDIRLFDKDIYMNYDSTYTENWYTSLVAGYDWNPYQYLINLAKLAKEDGVIKGILLHQGETNTGQEKWLSYVKKIYNDILTDLSLKADSVPILAGEVLSVSGSCCSSMNPIIRRLPDSIPTAHVISSSGCTGQDAAHFDSPGYRKLGRRYAVQMLSLLGYESVYAEAECGTVGSNLNILADNMASNSACVNSVESIEIPPTDEADIVKMSISVSTDTTYSLYGRFKTNTVNNKSLWFKIDNGDFELYDSLTTNGWEWVNLKSLNLSIGEHIISFAFSSDSIMLDKIVVKNSQIKSVDVGEEAQLLCNPDFISGLKDVNIEGYALEENYPNPAKNSNTKIAFKIPKTCHVSLKIYNAFGIMIDELAGKTFDAGSHSIEYNVEKLKSGIYLYSLQADRFTSTRKMIVSTN